MHVHSSCDKWLTNTDLLIVGLDIAHPAYSNVSRKDKSTIPSVVGVSNTLHEVFKQFYFSRLTIQFLGFVICFSVNVL